MTKGFRVSARTLVHLGAELISSDEIALYELIKNSFDAGSPRVRIDVVVPFPVLAVRSLAEEAKSAKAADLPKFKLRFQQLFYEQAPSVTKTNLVHQISQESKPESLGDLLIGIADREAYLEVSDDGEGMSKSLLDTVFMVVGTPMKSKLKGALDELGKPILGDKGIGRLSMMRLGRCALVSSQQTEDAQKSCIDFDWSLFDDPDTYLDDVPVEVKRCGKKDKVRGTNVRISGLKSDWPLEKVESFTRDFLGRLQNPFRQQEYPFPVDVHYNGGARLKIPTVPPWLLAKSNLKAYAKYTPPTKMLDETVLAISVEYSGPEGVRDKQSLAVNANEICHKLDVPPSLLTRLGPFELDLYWYNRGKLILDGLHNTKEYKEELDRYAGGLTLYRDGFRVGLSGSWDDDWLRLDSSALRKGGYVLNRLQVLGAVSLASKRNPHLVDRSNREGLIDGPEKDLLQRMLLGLVIEPIRGVIGAEMEAEQKSKLVEATSQERLHDTEEQLKRTKSALKEIAAKLPAANRPAVKQIENDLDQYMDKIRSLGRTLQTASAYREEVLELAGVGLVVEVVLHELARLTQGARDMILEFGDAADDPRAKQIVNSLEAQLKAINKRIRAVDPLSVSGRQRKEVFDIEAFVNTIVSGYEGRFKRHRITCEVKVSGRKGAGEIRVNLVRGLIGHIFENLLSNSVYWLQQISVGETSSRKIEIEIDAKSLAIIYSDTGPGISPEYKDMVFKPGITLKPQNKGKGLGLFIAREIAEYHGAKLYLDPSAGPDGRLRTFIFELPREARA